MKTIIYISMFAFAGMLLLTGCVTAQGGADRRVAKLGEDLNGATGNFFGVDLNVKSFELLKETVYDPQTGAGTSWHTVYWTDSTTVTEVAEKTSFAGLKAPVIVDFHGIGNRQP